MAADTVAAQRAGAVADVGSLAEGLLQRLRDRGFEHARVREMNLFCR